MAEVKTKVTIQDPKEFISTITLDSKKEDALVLLKLFEEITGETPKMWGTSIIGYGMYHYKSERSTQEGDWPLSAFSPRKQNLSLYIMFGNEGSDNLKKLGKHKSGKGCLYINKLSDVDMEVLKEMIKTSYKYCNQMFTKVG